MTIHQDRSRRDDTQVLESPPSTSPATAHDAGHRWTGDDPVVVVITGPLDIHAVAVTLQRVDSTRRIIVDVSQASGSSSMQIAVCVHLAVTLGRAVTVRGCQPTCAVSLKQMRLCHLVIVEESRS